MKQTAAISAVVSAVVFFVGYMLLSGWHSFKQESQLAGRVQLVEQIKQGVASGQTVNFDGVDAECMCRPKSKAAASAPVPVPAPRLRESDAGPLAVGPRG